VKLRKKRKRFFWTYWTFRVLALFLPVGIIVKILRRMR
jgi:hypothetical protein